MTTNSPTPPTRAETPANIIPTPVAQSQALSETEKDNRVDAQNRENIALGVLISSILAVVVISIAVVWGAGQGNRQRASERVMDSTLPLYGTWVGTILAFYFSRNAFEAASNATTRNANLFRQATNSSTPLSDNVLSKIVLKSLANDLIFSQSDTSKQLSAVVLELEEKNRYRTIVVSNDNNRRYKDLVYRIDAKAFLKQPEGVEPATISLQNYIDWRNEEDNKAMKPTVIFLPQTATLAEADAKLRATPGCRDVIVTTDGKDTSPVVVYVTDVDINEYKNTASSGLAA